MLFHFIFYPIIFRISAACFAEIINNFFNNVRIIAHHSFFRTYINYEIDWFVISTSVIKIKYFISAFINPANKSSSIL